MPVPWLALLLGVAGALPAQAPTPVTEWRQVPIGPLGFITGFVAHPLPPYRKYVRTDVGGSYRWDEGPRRWVRMDDRLVRDVPGYQGGIESIALDASNPSAVYVASGDIFRSLDAGQTWTSMNLRKSDGSRVSMSPNDPWRPAGERLAVDPNSRGQIVYFGSRRDGLWRTSNGGATWQQSGSFTGLGRAGAGISFVICDPRSGSAGQPSKTVYVGVIGNGVFRSQDAGATWTPLTGQPDQEFNPLRASLASDGTLFVAYNRGPSWDGGQGAIYRFRDGLGVNITPAGANARYAFCGISVDPRNPNRVVTGVWAWADNQSEIVWETVNAGQTWRPVSSVFSMPSWYVTWTPQNWNSTVTIDPADPKRLWKTDGFDVFSTPNGGATPAQWQHSGQGIEMLVGIFARQVPSGPILYGVADKIGFSLVDNGKFPESKWFPGQFGNGTSVDVCATRPQHVAIVAADDKNQPLASLSSDGGRTWKKFPTWPNPDRPFGLVAMSATRPEHLVVITNGNPGNIQVTQDGGKTWTQVTGPAAHWVYMWWTYQAPLASDRVDGNTFYLSTLDGVFWRSTDGGLTWRVVSRNVLPADWRIVVRAVPGRRGHLFAHFFRNDQGVSSLWQSRDGGSNWTKVEPLNETLGLGFGAPAPGSSLPTAYLVGTPTGQTRGAWRSTNFLSAPPNGVGAVWERIDSAKHPIPDAVPNGLEGDLTTFGRVVIGTGGRGVFVGELASPRRPPTQR